MPDRRDAPDREAGQVVRLARRRAADVGDAGDRGEPGEVDPVVAGDEAQHRLAAGARGDDEDERLDDLPEFGAERGRRFRGGMGGLVEDRSTSSVTPLRAAASRTRWIAGWTGASGTAGV